MSEMPDFSEYLDRFEAVCKGCNVAHDVLKVGPAALEDGCPACHAPRGSGFAFNVEGKAWVHSDKARLDIERRIAKAISQLFNVPGGVSVPVESRVIINVDPGPHRIILMDPDDEGRVAVVDYPPGTSDTVVKEYQDRFEAGRSIFTPDSTDPQLKLFEEVHQFARKVVSGTRIGPG